MDDHQYLRLELWMSAGAALSFTIFVIGAFIQWRKS